MCLVQASVKKIHEEKGLVSVGLQFTEAPEAMQLRIDEYVTDAIRILGPSCRADDLK